MKRAGGSGAVSVAAVCCLAAGAQAQSREIELGLEDYYYRTAETDLNRDDVLGLDRNVSFLRATAAWKESRGGARAVFRGHVERRFGVPGAQTRWQARQAYAQYWRGSEFGLRVGKQRVAWGSGFAWNPTNRMEPPKSPLNTGLEQEGVLAARVDLVPAPWASLVLVAARSDTARADLPTLSASMRRRAGAVRARFLVKDTDLALVLSGGRHQSSLVGFDMARSLGGPLSVHAEAAFYRGAELPPRREGSTFLRLVVGALRTGSESALSLEYFYNGEGYGDGQLAAYLAGLDSARHLSTDPTAPPPVREDARRTYLAGLAVPAAGGLGLRRHYAQASWSRGRIREKWTVALRGVVGLADGGVALTPGIGFAPRGDLTLNLDAAFFLGPARSEYRLLPLRGAAQIRIKALF